MSPKPNIQSWSSFVREPTSVLPQIEGGGAVILKRRDGEALVISTQARADSFSLGTELAAGVLVQILATSRKVIQRATDVALADRLPWLRLLSKDAKEQFLSEFFELMEACASVGNMSRLSELVADWKATAEAYSDRTLLARLTGRIDKPLGGTVAPPGQTVTPPDVIDLMDALKSSLTTQSNEANAQKTARPKAPLKRPRRAKAR